MLKKEDQKFIGELVEYLKKKHPFTIKSFEDREIQLKNWEAGRKGREEMEEKTGKIIEDFNKKASNLTTPVDSIERIKENLKLHNEMNWNLNEIGVSPVCLPQDEVVRILFYIVDELVKLKEK